MIDAGVRWLTGFTVSLPLAWPVPANWGVRREQEGRRATFDVWMGAL